MTASTTSTQTSIQTPQAASQSARVPVTPGALLATRLPMDPQIAPDGGQIAFTLYAFEADHPKRRGHIWAVATRGEGVNEARPLTTGNGSDYEARWSPDGRWLAFISTREEEGGYHKPQPYIMPASGGQAKRVCALPNGVADLSWAPDGGRLAFTSLEGPEPSRDPIVVGPGRHRRLWTVRLGADGAAASTPEPVTPDGVTIWEYAWSPDGARFAVFASEGPDETDWYRGWVGVVASAGGVVRRVAQPQGQAGALTWAPDSARLAYVSGEWSDRGLVGGDVFVVAVDDTAQGEVAEARNLTPGVGFSPSWLRWLPDGLRMLYAGWDGVTHQVGVLDGEDGALTPLSTDFVIGDYAWPRLNITPDLRHGATTHSTPNQPWEVYLGGFDFGETGNDSAPTGLTWRRLTRLNPILEETVAISPTRRLRYTGADGWEIDALYTPPLITSATGARAAATNEANGANGANGASQPGATKAPPLIVVVHGGPTSAWRDEWSGWATQLLASAGFAVLRPNIRGSMGRGVAFANAVLGDMGGKDFEDLMLGVDYIVAQGLADGDRVGIVGWSYGGFMTAWAVSQTPRFKAAVMGAGISDYHSFHAQTNIRDWDMRFIAADPNEQPEAYRARSAITYARQLTTPTLIIHGEQDVCVPVNQAYAFHYALRERNVPTELVVYPREGHGFTERAHGIDWEQRLVGWFKRYV